MILSEHTRRWLEVRFYQFCADIYKFRHKTIDIINVIETICQMSGTSFSSMKALTGPMLNDPYYQPTREEFVVLANLHGIKTREIANYMKRSPQAINEMLRTHKNSYYPSPRLSIDQDKVLSQFMDAADKIKKAGL